MDRDAQAVYADSLLEKGGDAALRGELIQLGLLAKQNARQKTRFVELSKQIAARWKQRGMIIERNGGFVTRWRCTPAQFEEHAAVAFDEEPMLRGLVLTFASKEGLKQAKAIAKVPQLARVVELELVGHKVRTGRPGPKGVAALLASKHWPMLEVLRLPQCALGDTGGKMIAASATMVKLRELDLFSNELHAKTVVALATSKHLRELRVLSLEQNKIGIAGVQAIANTTCLTKLERVVTVNTWLAPPDVRAIEQRFPGALVHTGQQKARR